MNKRKAEEILKGRYQESPKQPKIGIWSHPHGGDIVAAIILAPIGAVVLLVIVAGIIRCAIYEPALLAEGAMELGSGIVACICMLAVIAACVIPPGIVLWLLWIFIASAVEEGTKKARKAQEGRDETQSR